MIDPLRTELEELLARYAAGDADPDSVASVAREEPGFEARLQEIDRVRAELDAEVVADSDHLIRAATEEDHVFDGGRSAYDAFGASVGAATEAPRQWRLALAAAAGLLLLLTAFVVSRLPERPTIPREILLSQGGVLGDVRVAGDWSRISWDEATVPGTKTTVRIFFGGAPAGDPDVVSPSLSEPVWQPPDAASWPDEIMCEIQMSDASGQIIGNAYFPLRRNP